MRQHYRVNFIHRLSKDTADTMSPQQLKEYSDRFYEERIKPGIILPPGQEIKFPPTKKGRTTQWDSIKLYVTHIPVDKSKGVTIYYCSDFIAYSDEEARDVAKQIAIAVLGLNETYYISKAKFMPQGEYSTTTLKQ